MKPLRTEDLNKILQLNSVTKESYLGAFPACVFPKTSKKIYSFISNTSDHLDTKGEHWVGWFINGENVSFFDSYGRSPYDETLPYNFKTFVNNFRTVSFSNRRIQGWNSVACGYFTIHFIYTFCFGVNFENMFDDYSRRDFKRNDSIVYEIVNSII